MVVSYKGLYLITEKLHHINQGLHKHTHTTHTSYLVRVCHNFSLLKFYIIKIRDILFSLYIRKNHNSLHKKKTAPKNLTAQWYYNIHFVTKTTSWKYTAIWKVIALNRLPVSHISSCSYLKLLINTLKQRRTL